ADHGGIDEDADREAHTELLDGDGFAEREGAERAEEDEGGGRDHACGVLEADGNRLLVVAAVAEVLLDPREHEDLVVGGECKKDHIEKDRTDDRHEAEWLEMDERSSPSVLE